jgi:hypothetical protein
VGELEIAALFAGIGRSPVPVLLPFDTAGYLEGQADGTLLPLSRYQGDFRPADLFHAGPAGYDAVFSLHPGAGSSRTFAKPVEVQITGSILVYDLADPLGGKGEPVKTLAAQFPDMRRFIREGCALRLHAFGVSYVVSIQCLTGAARRLACREAYPIAERFLKACASRAGNRRGRLTFRPIVERPTAFTRLHYPGRRHHCRSVRGGGRADFAAYSQIRFPLKAPAGPLAILRQASPGGPRRLSVADNFAKPAASRSGNAAGFGHQGQDIRPAPCPPNSNSESVAIRGSRPWWRCATHPDPLTEAAGGNAADQYLHRAHPLSHAHEPVSHDADGISTGAGRRGRKIGVVSNYLDFERHLVPPHFDVQVFTRDGWIWVNPYTTLIASYERLIRGRGREIGSPIAAAVAHALPEDVLRHGTREGREN